MHRPFRRLGRNDLRRVHRSYIQSHPEVVARWRRKQEAIAWLGEMTRRMYNAWIGIQKPLQDLWQRLKPYAEALEKWNAQQPVHDDTADSTLALLAAVEHHDPDTRL